jgi:hypothetical protein
LGGWVVVVLAWIAFDPPAELKQWPWLISFAKYLAAAGYIAKARMQRDVDVYTAMSIGSSKDKP